MNDCDATVLLNVYIYLVFVGEGYLEQVHSYLPHLRHMRVFRCKNVRGDYDFEVNAVIPKKGI